MASATSSAPAARLELLVGGIDLLLGGAARAGTREPVRRGVACEAPPWARERRGAMLPERASGCQPRRSPAVPRLGEICENSVKSCRGLPRSAPRAGGMAIRGSWPSHGRPSTPTGRFTQVRARIDCRRTTGAPLEPKGASTRDRLRPLGWVAEHEVPTLPRVLGGMGIFSRHRRESIGDGEGTEIHTAARRADRAFCLLGLGVLLALAPPCPPGRHPGADRAARDGS